MPSWNELVDEIERLPSEAEKVRWIREYQQHALEEVSQLRNNRNVIFYASAFLSKPLLPSPSIQLTHEELNGFMSCMHGMDWTKGLSLILHTPGGVVNAAETIVAYLFSKFNDIEVIIPTFAMSAGTMISLAADRIVMGRQSQLGPIDPQMPLGGRTVSARAVVDQFERARDELSKDLKLAHLWAPILQSLGPSVLQEAQNALEYGEGMVKGWLETHMFKNRPDAAALASQAASYFNQASLHKSHGKRIDRHEARTQQIVVEDLETNQNLQEWVLTSYHLMTIVFEKSPACKVLVSNHNKMWVKNAAQIQLPMAQIPIPR